MTTHRIDLHTRDGQQLHFDCEAGLSLLDAAEAAHITLPAQCRQGSCGACHAQVRSGDYQLGEHSAHALPAAGPHTRSILMCRTTPCSDLQVELPCDHAQLQFHTVPRRSASVVRLTPLADHTVQLVLQLAPDDTLGSAAEFEPGQFMELELPGTGVRRAYSLANTGNWDGTLEFMIRLQPGGQFSGFLRDVAQPGMTLAVRGPLGGFGIDPASLRPRWLLAGGTGLAPMLSILRRMADYQEPQPVRLFFGVNRESELFALDELQGLQTALPQLQVTLCVWQPQAGWTGHSGTPVEALRLALADQPGPPDLYLCGPPALIDAAQQTALAAGVPAAQVFSERFVSG